MSATVDIGGDNVSVDVKRLDIWRKDFEVGRWEVQLLNDDYKHDATFAVNDMCYIQIGGVTLIRGRLDDFLPIGMPISSEQTVRLLGRDKNRGLQNYFMSTEAYTDGLTEIDTIVDEAIDAGIADGTIVDINAYVAAIAGAPTYPAVFDRTFLLDGFKEFLEANNYLIYIDDAGNVQLYSAALAPASGEVLTSRAGLTTNNILDFDPYGQKRGFDIRNYIYVLGPLVSDHWTEGNAADFTELNNFNAATNETGVFLFGSASIRASVSAVAADQHFALDFTGTLYHYASLDYSVVGLVDAHMFVRSNNAAVGYVYVWLEDDGAREIFFQPVTITVNTWQKIIFPVGIDAPINAGASENSWYGNAAFNWNIMKVGIKVINAPMGSLLYVDGLSLPTWVIGIDEDTGGGSSQALYGKRMLPVTRYDVKSQHEIDGYATSILNKHKDPLETIHCFVVGNTGLRYTMETVPVTVEDSNVAAPTTIINNQVYRIQMLHHMFGDHLVPRWGRQHVTELFLVKQLI